MLMSNNYHCPCLSYKVIKHWEKTPGAPSLSAWNSWYWVNHALATSNKKMMVMMVLPAWSSKLNVTTCEIDLISHMNQHIICVWQNVTLLRHENLIVVTIDTGGLGLLGWSWPAVGLWLCRDNWDWDWSGGLGRRCRSLRGGRPACWGWWLHRFCWWTGSRFWKQAARLHALLQLWF